MLQQFGEPMPFATNDEDGASGNDSNAGNVDVPSSGKLVYLSLGRFDPGQSIELMMIVRGTAFTQSSGGLAADHRCVEKNSELFCSRGSMSVNGQNADAPQITLLP